VRGRRKVRNRVVRVQPAGFIALQGTGPPDAGKGVSLIQQLFVHTICAAPGGSKLRQPTWKMDSMQRAEMSLQSRKPRA
jgi:hypothetical protein